MPLTAKGEEIKSKMETEYGQKKGESVFYASRNAGAITGVDSAAYMNAVRRNDSAGMQRTHNHLLKGSK